MGKAFTEIAAGLRDAFAPVEGGDTEVVEHKPDVIDVQATGAARLVNHLPKPGPDRRTSLRRAPLELIDRFAALIPPPRLHRHRCHGVLAPNAPLRATLTALARAPAASAGR